MKKAPAKLEKVEEVNMSPSQLAKTKIVEVIFFHLKNGAINLIDLVELSSILSGEAVRIINQSSNTKKEKL